MELSEKTENAEVSYCPCNQLVFVHYTGFKEALLTKML